jgi:transposase InsO family protein
VDLLGPLQSHTNNKYILAITDAFTKVGVLAPLPDKEATTVAKALQHHWIYRFSISKQIHSDQGKKFCNKILQELFSLLGPSHTTTTA